MENTIFEKVRKICDEQNISITDLEKKAGLGNGTVGKWKTSKPNVNSLCMVANVLKVDVSQLI